MITKWCMCWYSALHFWVNTAALFKLSNIRPAEEVPLLFQSSVEFDFFFFFRFCFSSYFNELLVCLWWCDYEEDLGIIFCAWVEPTESLWTKRGDKQLTTKRLRSTFMSPSSLSFWKPPLNTWIFHLIFKISSYSAANSFFKENQFTSNSL